VATYYQADTLREGAASESLRVDDGGGVKANARGLLGGLGYGFSNGQARGATAGKHKERREQNREESPRGRY
jgi:hypothetical protein